MAPNRIDLELSIHARTDQGYPVELRALQLGIHSPRGYLAPDVPTWDFSLPSPELGARLFAALVTDSGIGETWAKLTGRADQRAVHLYLDPDAPELHAVPWEMLRTVDGHGQGLDLAAADATPFSRYMADDRPVPELRPGERLRLLVAVAAPDGLKAWGQAEIDAEVELAAIRDAVDNTVDLTVVPAPVTLAAIAARLPGAHLLHIVAHGQFDEESETPALLLANEQNQPTLVQATKLVEQIAGVTGDPSHKLRLVFLASCRSATESPRTAFRSLAGRLVQAGVPAVLAMQDLVPIPTAQAFTEAFYRELAGSSGFDLAANRARREVLARGQSGAAIPVLIMRYRPVSGQEADPLALARARLAELPTDHIPSMASLPPGSSRLLPANRNFTGRDAELKQLAASLKRGSATAIGQALTGMGGIGKSQLALEFAHRYGQYFLGGVAWMSFADAGAVPNEVALRCAALPGLPPDVSQLDLPDQVELIRQAWQRDLPRLLIFDNCEEEDLLAEWLPTSGGSRVLVTSRRAAIDWSLNLELLPLATLPRPDSMELLTRLIRTVSREQATIPPATDLDAVAAELGDLPLALHMAGTYLGRYHATVTVPAYLAEIRAINPLDHPSLAEAVGRSPTAHDLHVARTFQVSLDRLQPNDDQDALALALLARAACFAPGEPIPVALLAGALAEKQFEEIDEIVAADGLKLLADVGLLELNVDALTLHRLVARFVRTSVVDSDAQLGVVRMVIRYAYSQNMTGDPRAMRPWLAHLIHVAAVAGTKEDELAASVLANLGYHLHLAGDLAGARPHLEHALMIHRKIHGDNNPNTATSLNNLGSVLRAQGDLEGAATYYSQALAIRLEVLGTEHPDTAHSLNSLGIVSQDLGNLSNAKLYLVQALMIFMRVLGYGHPDMATSMNNLGSLFHVMGELSAARIHYEQALAIRRAVLGEKHPDTAQSLNNLGYLLRSLGDLSGANSYYGQALAICQDVLGEGHVYTSVCLNNIGMLRQAMGDLAGAKPCLEKALAIRREVLNHRHPDTALGLNNLGAILYATGDLTAAKSCIEQALEIDREILGVRHPDTAIDLDNLAGLLHAQGDLASAKYYHEQALTICLEVFGERHPATAYPLNNMGSLLRDLGDLSGARVYYKRALAIRREVLGEGHPDTALSLWWMGVITAEQGNLREARPYYVEALAIYTDKLGVEHPRTQSVRGWLKRLDQELGR